MSHSQPSATGKLKRNAAVFAVAFVGIGVILHFALPWFDFIQMVGYTLGFAADYPRAAAIPVALLALFFLMAVVDDRFSP